MPCNCSRTAPLAQRTRFGGCDFCLHAALAGFICSWLLMIPLFYVRLPLAPTLLLCLPALFFTPWLALHLMGRRSARTGA